MDVWEGPLYAYDYGNASFSGDRYNSVRNDCCHQPGDWNAHFPNGELCLIVSCSISGDTLGAISKRIVPFLAILIIDLLIIAFFSPLTMWMAQLVAK